jgi:hypothetical protein
MYQIINAISVAWAIGFEGLSPISPHIRMDTIVVATLLADLASHRALRGKRVSQNQYLFLREGALTFLFLADLQSGLIEQLQQMSALLRPQKDHGFRS